MPNTPDDIVARITAGDTSAFEDFFSIYYERLVNLATGILKDRTLAEEQVQEVFITIWERRKSLKANVKLLPYLITSVRNRCYNFMRDRQVAQKHIDQIRQSYREQLLSYEYEEVDEHLIDRLRQAIEELPEKCREVFKLSRFEGMSHKEISAKLQISAKTVERHITRAIKALKSQMGNALNLFILLLGDIW
ncbi:MAG: RNA polymerase sigma-70 factor [Cyclobacteriaceae bacterium]